MKAPPPDYHEIGTSIAEIIAKCSKPLAEQQKIQLTGAVAIWLLQRDQRIEQLENALGNCRMLAMRKAFKDPSSDWLHIIRFCKEVGIEPSPLRAEMGKRADEVKP